MEVAIHWNKMGFICFSTLSNWWPGAFWASHPFIPRNICSPVPGWLTRPRCPLASLLQKAATACWAPVPACPRALVHAMAKPEAPGGRAILCLLAQESSHPHLWGAGDEGGMLLRRQAGCYRWSGFPACLLMFIPFIPVSTASLTDVSRQVYLLLGMHRFKVWWQCYRIIIYPI